MVPVAQRLGQNCSKPLDACLDGHCLRTHDAPYLACKLQVAAGCSCSFDSECWSGKCDMTSNECVLNKVMGFQDPCESSSECISGLCVQKKCAAYMQNEACQTSTDCHPRLYCDSKTFTCQNKAAGATCKYALGPLSRVDDICPGYQTCAAPNADQTLGTCVDFGILGTGSRCTSSNMMGCSTLYCSPTKAVCDVLPATCSNTFGCGNHHLCTCASVHSNVDGTCTPGSPNIQCLSTLLAMERCLWGNSCYDSASRSALGAPNSCASRNCRTWIVRRECCEARASLPRHRDNFDCSAMEAAVTCNNRAFSLGFDGTFVPEVSWLGSDQAGTIASFTLATVILLSIFACLIVEKRKNAAAASSAALYGDAGAGGAGGAVADDLYGAKLSDSLIDEQQMLQDD
jgi:hypothetical protein